MSNINRQYRRRLQKGTPKERTPHAGLADAMRQAAGIPARPTPEQMEVVTGYINWLLATPMPKVREIVNDYIHNTGKSEQDPHDLAFVLTVGFVFITSMPRVIGDEVEQALAQAFRSGL